MVAEPSIMELLLENFANIDSLLRIYPLLLQGLVYTFWLSVAALPLGMLLGLAIAVLYSFRHRWLNIALLVYIDLFRSFPVVVLLVLIFFGLPFLGLTLGGFPAAVLAIVLNNSGYYGEIFRAGILSVPQGQSDAGRALGFKPLHLVFYIVLPQAIRNVMAPLASNSLELVKTTPIAALVALPELLRSARVAQEQTYNPTPLTAAAVIFFVMLYPFARWVARLERQALKAR
jgi:polar amino acid transport system permease protein